MTMTVRYNSTANRALAHTDKNDKVSSKALGKITSGLKITSAADDAASFSIGARMKVKLRSLDQAAVIKIPATLTSRPPQRQL